MPPPRALQSNPKLIFVNRKEECRRFLEATKSVPADGLRLLVFHGAGGQGKTRLLTELAQIAKGPNFSRLCVAELDMELHESKEPILLAVVIRNLFSKAGVECTTFEVALAHCWDLSGQPGPYPTLPNAALSPYTSDIQGEVVEGVQQLMAAGLDAMTQVPVSGTLFWVGKLVWNRLRAKQLKRAFSRIWNLPEAGPSQLAERLLYFLAQDLNDHLKKNSDERFVLFVDAYERIFEDRDFTKFWRENKFDKQFRQLLTNTNGLLAVFGSRRTLPWSEDPDWQKDLEEANCELSGLMDDDAEEWLRQVDVRDQAICTAMIEGAQADGSVYPLLLDLQVEHWCRLSAENEPFGPEEFLVTAKDFQERLNELVERVLQGYSDNLQATLRRLAVARRFDQDTFEFVVRTFATGLPLEQYDQFPHLSLVYDDAGGWLRLHDTITKAIAATLGESEHRKTVKALCGHFEARATVKHSIDVTEEVVTSLKEAARLRRQLALEGYVEWLAPLAHKLHEAAWYGTCEQLWRDALALVEEQSGEEHLETAASYHNLASNFRAQGRFDEAENFFRKSLRIHSRVLGDDHPDTATSYNNLASTLDAQGRYDEAEPLLRKSLEICMRVHGEGHPDTAGSYNNLALHLHDRGRYEEAEPLLRKSLKVHERVRGEEHPNTATSYNNLALNLDAQGRYDEAEPLLRKSMEVRKRVLGEDHPETAGSYNNLAFNLDSQGRYAEAEPFYRTSLRTHERALGQDHPETAKGYNNLAANLISQNRYAEAKPYLHKSLEVREKMLGEMHPDTASSCNNLAHCLDVLGRFKEAEVLLRKGICIQERVLGDKHPDTATSYSNLASNLDAQGHHIEAESLLRKSLETLEGALGSRHRRTANTYHNLAYNLNAQHRYAAAEPLFRKSLEILESVLQDKDAEILTIYRNLARCLDALGRFAEAEEIRGRLREE